MRFILYARKSSESDDRQALSIESQIDTLRALAERRGFIVVHTFRESKSAKEPGRPEFNAMLTMLDEGKADGILCWKFDRLARNPVDAGVISWRLQKGAIQQIATPERDYYPSDNVLLMSVEFGMANQFILDLRKSVIRGMESKAKSGWPPGKPPCGYINEPHARTVVKDDQNFPLVEGLLRRALTGKYTPIDLLRVANEELHIKARIKGQLVDKPIGKHLIHAMLRNPYYAGFFIRNGKRYPGAHTPMITEVEHEKLLEIFGTSECREKTMLDLRAKPRKATYKLGGIIQCPCGRQVSPWPAKNRNQGKTYLYYVCSTQFQKRYRDRCTARPIRSELLEQEMERCLSAIALHPKMITWLQDNAVTAQQQEETRQQQLLHSLGTRLGQCEERKKKLLDFALGGTISQDDYKVRREEIDAEVASIHRQQTEINDEMQNCLTTYREVIDIGGRVLEIFRTGTFDEVKKMLRTIADRIILENREISITLKRPFQTVSELAIQKSVDANNG